jgi:hypothetical protein
MRKAAPVQTAQLHQQTLNPKALGRLGEHLVSIAGIPLRRGK